MTSSALFPDLQAAATIVQQRYGGAFAKYADAAAASTEAIESALLAAEADASRRLRIHFAPTTIISDDASEDEREELEAIGERYATESAYDYEPALRTPDDWGYLVLRQKPVIRIERIEFAYPAPTAGIFRMPDNWIRLDRKAGHLRFVPNGPSLQAGPLSVFILSSMAGGRVIPAMIRVRYVAGLQNAARDFPDLVDVVKKMAILRMLQTAFLPQSGSISADGLSQSTSLDIQKWHDGVDDALDVLMQAIHGPRMTVL
jgi:hypothetical protein